MVTDGRVTIRLDGAIGPDGAVAAVPPALDLSAAGTAAPSPPLHAEDMVECGPRGESFGRTVTEADLVGWTDFTGELDPRALDGRFASRAIFGERTAPPMWTFCRSFGDFLRELLTAPMPSSGFAGHLGDSWRVVRPVRIGDTLRTRHRPIAWKPSASRPGMGIVEFAVHTIDADERVVLEGRVVMMIPMRSGRSPDAG